MLTKLKLVNFQPHVATTLDIAPDVTIISGPNDSGKSSMIRALQWLCLNQAPDRLVHHGADKALVTLYLDDHRVNRKRAGKANSYKLDGKEFKAMGLAVPEEVASVLNVSTINFQGQIDPPFWFTETAGQVSRELNKIINLDAIDKVLGGVALKLRQARSEVAVSEQRLKQAESKVKDLAWVPDMEADFQRLEELHERKESKAGDADRLSSLWASATEAVESKENALAAYSRLREVLGHAKQARLAGRQASDLGNLVNKARRLTGILEQGRPDYTPVEQLREAAIEARTRWHSLKSLLELAKESEASKCRYQKESSASWNLLKKLLASQEGNCPLCGQPLPSSAPAFISPTKPRVSATRRLNGTT